VHSPGHKGFFYSHVGWIFVRRHDRTDLARVPDLAAYPELLWLHRHETAPAIALALLTFVIGGWQGLVVGFVWSTLLVYHATFAINSLAHVVGSRRYVTGDDSRNNFLLAIATLGEGWHNNHHAFQSSARQGFRWWEVDLSFYALRGLALCGLVSNLKNPPAGVIRNEQRLGVKVIHRTAERLAARFDPDRIASSLQSELTPGEVAALRAKLEQPPAPEAPHFHFHLPSREALVAEAQRLFAKTPSLDEIVDRAQQLLFRAVGQSLARA
jgi:stearoyl-CoA desaturase (delta-9 desaturase)